MRPAASITRFIEKIKSQTDRFHSQKSGRIFSMLFVHQLELFKMYSLILVASMSFNSKEPHAVNILQV